jgi:3-hydroxyisobutyrate dehydrogenase
MGKNIFNCKGYGGGQIAKTCNNMALAIQMVSVAEALALCSKLGLDPKTLADVMVTASSRLHLIMQMLEHRHLLSASRPLERSPC